MLVAVRGAAATAARGGRGERVGRVAGEPAGGPWARCVVDVVISNSFDQWSERVGTLLGAVRTEDPPAGRWRWCGTGRGGASPARRVARLAALFAPRRRGQVAACTSSEHGNLLVSATA